VAGKAASDGREEDSLMAFVKDKHKTSRKTACLS